MCVCSSNLATYVKCISPFMWIVSEINTRDAEGLKIPSFQYSCPISNCLMSFSLSSLSSDLSLTSIFRILLFVSLCLFFSFLLSFLAPYSPVACSLENSYTPLYLSVFLCRRVSQTCTHTKISYRHPLRRETAEHHKMRRFTKFHSPLWSGFWKEPAGMMSRRSRW